VNFYLLYRLNILIGFLSYGSAKVFPGLIYDTICPSGDTFARISGVDIEKIKGCGEENLHKIRSQEALLGP
jgi:hypothetical protein